MAAHVCARVQISEIGGHEIRETERTHVERVRRWFGVIGEYGVDLDAVPRRMHVETSQEERRRELGPDPPVVRLLGYQMLANRIHIGSQSRDRRRRRRSKERQSCR